MAARLTRREVARRLGVTIGYVCSTLDKKFLHPAKDEAGHVTYDETDVEQALLSWRRVRAPKRARADYSITERIERGRLAAAVFECIERGMDRAAIVIATKGDPQWVNEFWDDYHTSPEERRAHELLREDENLRREMLRHHEQVSLSRERVSIRKVIAEADLLRARRGDDKSKIAETSATTNENGVPVLPALAKTKP